MERKDPPFQRQARRSGAHWVAPRLLAQIGFSEWTTDGMLRHQRFQGLRRVKQPAEVVREDRMTAAGRDGASGLRLDGVTARD